VDNPLIAPTSEQFKNEASKLLSSLDALLEMLREGRWDEIGDIESQLLTALKAVGSPVKLTQATVNRGELEQLIQKLERAIEECNIRKAQISPLINAFSVNQHKQS
jgi:hypothetical protein